MAKNVGMCMNIQGFISNTRYPAGYKGLFKHDDGTPMSPYEARNELFDEVRKGRKVIPCNPDCKADPCPMKDRGCTGFNYAGAGCPGYEAGGSGE